MFKSLCLALSVAVASVSLATLPLDAQAKRLGGGKPAGMQRATPDQPANASPNNAAAPQQQMAPRPANAVPATPAAAPKRSWLGPIAGLAAGLGIAALLSHFGMGEAVANGLMMMLLAGAAIFLVVWLLRKFAGKSTAQPALAGAGAAAGPGAGGSLFGQSGLGQSPAPQPAYPAPMQRQGAEGNLFSSLNTTPAAAQTAAPVGVASLNLPADFDRPGFERVCKMIFVRLQAANDAADLDDLRKFTTPELFASLRLDLQDRGHAKQQTDVVQVDAQLVDWARENGQQVASVRYTGMIREEAGAAAAPFDEVWHLVKPLDDSRDWAIAGITPTN